MALDSNGVAYVVFRDNIHTDKASVMWYTGGNWEILGASGFSSGYSYEHAIALDSNNKPYVVYQDGSNSSKLTVQVYSGGSWAPLGMPGFTSQ